MFQTKFRGLNEEIYFFNDIDELYYTHIKEFGL